MEGVNPVQSQCYFNNFSFKESLIVDQEIEKLLDMKVIKEVEHHPNEFISPIFLVPKKNGEYRMILNLKELNTNIVYHHFKMETFESVLKLVKPNCFFASVDIRHAYYMIPIHPLDQVKLRFQKSGKLYQFVSMPNGISCAPRLYTKLMKPVYASLRSLGHSNSGYIDDSLLLGDTKEECQNNVTATVSLMTDLGFIIHEKKSVLVPTKTITFLGNNIDSDKMLVTLPIEKVCAIVQECRELFKRQYVKIRSVARVLGLMVSTFSAVEFAPLFYRTIEKEKILALKSSQGDFESTMFISDEMKSELKWWIDNLATQKRHICHGNADMIITTDASSYGWGAICKGKKVGGRWNDLESQSHINYLELLAVSHALKVFCKFADNIHVQIKSDNSCTVSYLNKMGGVRSEQCNKMAKQIWKWCIVKSIWLSASHIPGIENEADFESRNFKDNVEWKLNSEIFHIITEIWGQPAVDMFASRLNKQIERFVSWHPDPDCIAVDAFSLNWSNELIYAFPPFSLIGRLVQKLRHDQGEMILVAPVWLTQGWFTAVMELLIDLPRIFRVRQDTLSLTYSDRIHPLANHLHLMACRLSGKCMKTETFRRQQQTSLCLPGELLRRSSIPPTLIDGFHTVVKGKLINFLPL
ncbi:MAG: reverse transcriptase domain-containing protein [Candidatus Thiodiazotropha sp.]